MSEKKTSAAVLRRGPVVVERTFRARVDEVWDLWTTKDGFESWWGPEGFRVEVAALDARVGGALSYEMIADAPEMVEAMTKMGQAVRHGTHGTFTEVKHHQRLAITHVIDFLPGVAAYESTMVVELFPSGPNVRMVVTLEAMHDEEITRMSVEGFTSQLRKLERRFGSVSSS